MKTEYLFVILLVLIGFSSCEDSTSDATLELSQSTFENISSDGATLTVNITSSDSWTAASSSTHVISFLIKERAINHSALLWKLTWMKPKEI